jgi:hypothetical protein
MIDLELLLQPGVGQLKACQRHGFFTTKGNRRGGGILPTLENKEEVEA